MKQELLKLIKSNARLPLEDIADALNTSVDDVARLLDECEHDGTIVSYTTIINDQAFIPQKIKAIIELSVRPEQQKGYSAIAKRIQNHPQVVDLHLVSGHYDFLIVLEGDSLQDISALVSEFASLENVQKTATHVVLNTYKKSGVNVDQMETSDRLPIMP